MTDRPALALWAALAAILALRVAAGLDPGMRLWGLDPHRSLPPALGWGLLALSALPLVPAVAGRLLPGARTLGEAIGSSRRAPAVAALAAMALCWFLYDRVWFTGDFLLRQGFAEWGRTEGPFAGAQPLDRFLHNALPSRFASSWIGFANLVARVIGALEAGAFGWVAGAFARASGWRGETALLGTGVLLFGGYLTMFTGLGKAASEMCLLVAAFALFGVRVARERRGMLGMGVVLSLAFMVHRSSLMLLPAWILTVADWACRPPVRRPERGLEAFAAIAIPVATMAATMPGILAVAANYDLGQHVITPEVAARGWFAATLDPARLMGVLNVMAALTPLGFVAPWLLAGNRGEHADHGRRRFLIVLALAFVPALLLIRPQHGAFKDWDVFAPAAVAWSALAAFELARALDGSRRAWLAVPLTTAVIVPALQWLLVNRDAQSGLERVRAYADHGSLASVEERAHAWDFLTARNFRLGRWPEAAEAAARASHHAPHRRTLLTWALAETMNGDHRTAATVYRRMLAHDPEDPLAWVGIAGAGLRLGDTLAADSALAKIRSFGADGREAALIRRHLTFFPQVWPDSSERDRSP